MNLQLNNYSFCIYFMLNLLTETHETFYVTNSINLHNSTYIIYYSNLLLIDIKKRYFCTYILLQSCTRKMRTAIIGQYLNWPISCAHNISFDSCRNECKYFFLCALPQQQQWPNFPINFSFLLIPSLTKMRN